MARNPQIQARIVQNQWKKKQELLACARKGYIRGTLTAAKLGKKMLEEGETGPQTFEKELLRRMKIVLRR